ncbi:hypothetical protein ACFXCR_16505, partial [Streptomyces sp. NPDC059431]|uniref:hypothetical protein n=1 Tax=Streptomyces sp. NPDC059431 TaxID=3346828 RepID=UPI003691BA85
MATRPEGWGVEQIAAHLGVAETDVRESPDELARVSLNSAAAAPAGGGGVRGAAGAAAGLAP